ncbi:uncharacterized protein RCO7_09770 [Rhynchosporium graminicola]|uniref:Uncharacterized protein n=1 Tax=Rhynchosporium graminicola TaxID=2792576 RepID=A0A1E1LAI9_9HELO|nr:uncharacterized protein RCO7_09770 [Rhynchosporium commune]
MAEEQIWFFIWESTKPSTKSPPYQQGWLPLSEVVRQGLTLQKALTTSRAPGQVSDQNFWIHSNSMSAAVQLLTDQSIKVTWELYCKKDAVVTIHIRPNKDPSPNASRASSHQQSLADRRKQSGRRAVSEIFVRPPLSQITSALDTLSLGPINKLDSSDKVTLDLGGGKSETFSKEYLLGWITSEIMTAGKDAAGIKVTSLTKNRRPVEVTLNNHFLGGNYFSPDFVAKILALPMGMVTVKDKLDQLTDRKVTRENQNKICAAHDLAPLFEAALGIQWDIVKAELNKEAIKEILAGDGSRNKFGATLNRIRNSRGNIFSSRKGEDRTEN